MSKMDSELLLMDPRFDVMFQSSSNNKLKYVHIPFIHIEGRDDTFSSGFLVLSSYMSDGQQNLVMIHFRLSSINILFSPSCRSRLLSLHKRKRKMKKNVKEGDFLFLKGYATTGNPDMCF